MSKQHPKIIKIMEQKTKIIWHVILYKNYFDNILSDDKRLRGVGVLPFITRPKKDVYKKTWPWKPGLDTRKFNSITFVLPNF